MPTSERATAGVNGTTVSNGRRLEPIGEIPSAEAEAIYCAASVQLAWPQSYGL